MLIVLAVLLSLSSVIMVFSSKAWAASKYDDVYQTTSELILSDGIQNRCEKENITYSWDTYFDHEKYKMYDSFSNKEQLKKKLDDARASFNRAKISGVYGVTLSKSVGVVGSGKSAVNIYWSEDKSAELEWAEGLLNIKNVYVLSITCGKEFEQGTNKYVSMVSYPYKTSTIVSASDGLQLNFFITGKDFEYPEGYEGKKLYATPDMKTPLSPQWVLSVDRRRVTGHVQDPNKDDVKRCLTLRIKDKDDNILFERTQENPGISCAKVLPFTWTAPALGAYYFETEFFVPIPFIAPENEKWVKQRVKFEVNGQSYMMSDKTQHCDEDGKCEDFDPVRLCDFNLEQARKSLSKPNIFEAAAYALDWYGCFLNAKMVEFWNFLRDLFIPALPDLKGPFNQLSDALSKKLGFLFYPFKWFIQLFQALINATSSCSIDTSQVPGANANGLFWGRPVRLSVCSAERDLPQVYNVSVFFIRIVTVFGLLYSLYHRLVNLLTTDRIVKAAQEGRK
jgi:hypothetical protein